MHKAAIQRFLVAFHAPYKLNKWQQIGMVPLDTITRESRGVASNRPLSEET
jgi:hypothetical protein